MFRVGDAYVFKPMKMSMDTTAVGSASVRSKCRRQDTNGPLWLRLVQALVSPAARWAGLGMLTLNVLVCLVACWFPGSPPGTATGQSSSLVSWGYPPGMTSDWYLKHRQWRADLRTTLEVAKYVFSPEFDSWGSPDLRQTGPFLSATTNHGTTLPSV
jgi:hypothetical protein